MASAYTTSLIQSFLAQHAQDIVTAISNTGLFFAAVVAQLSVESANGTSQLAVKYNNYGGIKGTKGASDSVALQTTECNSRTPTTAYFKTYDSFADFMTDYVSTFQQPAYIQAGVFTATTPQNQISAMVNAGYSTMTASAYLASGVSDRISATQSLVPIGTISDTATADATLGIAPANTYSICCILGINKCVTPTCG